MGRRPDSTEFLKECMADALLVAMRGKPVAKITVDEIAKATGVNRSTWFRHFGSKGEALTFKLTTLWLRWAEAHGLRERQRFALENAGTFFEFNYSIKDTLAVIYLAGMQQSVLDAFYQIMMPRLSLGPEEGYEARFFALGLFGMLDEWVNRGFRESPEEVSATLQRMLAGRAL